ncbi:MAG: hypothetical protein V3V08_24720 [Nannocystaceae bacterium]
MGEPSTGAPASDSDSDLDGGGGSASLEACDDASLVWKSGRKTHYTSYPDPDSEECADFNGCEWTGLFAGCQGIQPEPWVRNTNIAAAYPQFRELAHHELCIKSGGKRMIVNIIDTCSDEDCDGCCTRNQGDADALIDLEDYTDARWGRIDGEIEWADLGPRANPVCD